MKIAAINGLRGLAIVGVVIHHLVFLDIKYGLATTTLNEVCATLLSSGWLAVNLFFFLSGFVLYLPFAKGERVFSDRHSVALFYRHRFKRLFPLYWICSAFSLIFVSSIPANDARFFEWIVLLVTVSFPFSEGTFLPRAINWVLLVHRRGNLVFRPIPIYRTRHKKSWLGSYRFCRRGTCVIDADDRPRAHLHGSSGRGVELHQRFGYRSFRRVSAGNAGRPLVRDKEQAEKCDAELCDRKYSDRRQHVRMGGLVSNGTAMVGRFISIVAARPGIAADHPDSSVHVGRGDTIHKDSS